MMRIILLFLVVTISSFTSEKPFVVVVSTCNNLLWVKKNLDSIFRQNYSNFRVIYVSDATTDGTEEYAKAYAAERGLENRILFLRNPTRSGQLSCIVQGVNLCDPDEIVIDLDGADWLSHDHVMEKLNNIYEDPEVWMTYGQFLSYPSYREGFAQPIPEDVIENNSFRSMGGVVTHLRTFYAGLFQRINKEDFLWEGKFILKAGDLAYSIPMLEMSGEHTHFISDPIYIYNTTDPSNPFKSSNQLEADMDHYIRSKPKYFPLIDLFDEGEFPLDSIYRKIKDLRHPTIAEFQELQKFLMEGERENIARLEDMQQGIRNMKIVGNIPSEFPRAGMIAVNSNPEERENCIILYSSFNRNYPGALKRLVETLKNSDFKGHIRYRLGGWPNLEEGDLKLAHIPYGFKVASFREARRLGYKRVFWLDSAVLPLINLDEVFQEIEKKGYFVMGNSHRVGPYMHPAAAAFFGLSVTDTYEIPSCSAGLFGVDLTKMEGNKIIDWWYRAALDRDAFFSARSDQSALSMILYKMGLNDFVPLEKMPHSRNEIGEGSIFLLDREFAHGF